MANESGAPHRYSRDFTDGAGVRPLIVAQFTKVYSGLTKFRDIKLSPANQVHGCPVDISSVAKPKT
jgi:hypothetical protein